MLFTRKIGDAEVGNVVEYSGPTHDPSFLFPDMPREVIEENLHWLAPHHFSPRATKRNHLPALDYGYPHLER